MASPQYRKRHQAERAMWASVIARGGAMCAEPRCIVEERGGTREIPAWWAGTQLWHLSHDETGQRTIGPSHRRCNLAENARRNNPKRKGVRRWIL